MDAGVIVGYLVAKLLSRATRFADSKIDALLDRLFEHVFGRLGGDKALERLVSDPKNGVAQEWAATSLEHAARADPAFGQKLATLQAELQRTAPDLIVHAPNAGTVVGVNHGYLIQGGNVVINRYSKGHRAEMFAAAPLPVKVVQVVALALILSGFGTFGYTFFNDMPRLGDPDFMEMPRGIRFAAGLFFAGFVLGAVGNTVHAWRNRDDSRR